MREFQTSRRAFLKVSGGTVGALAVPAAFAMPRGHGDAAELGRQASFLRSVLHKQVNHSDTIRRKHVDKFVAQFGETYGLVDYRGLYSGLVGEYRLTRLFVRSLHLASRTGGMA